MESELHSRGFFLLKGALNPSEVEKGLSTIKDRDLDYSGMEQFVRGPFLGKINGAFSWSTVYTKYRVSDNNNSVDASAFHRDIFPINGAESAGAPPVYTILTYFDKTVMEIIPGSHNELDMSYGLAVRRYFDAERLVIEPGDMLIFHATLLHRGIFTEKQVHRRVLQVFDCFPSNNIFQQYNEKICHIPGNEKFQGAMMTIARTPGFIFFSNIAGFLNSATGHGSHLADMTGVCSVEAYNYLSSEGLTKRASQGGVQPLNKYFLRDPSTVNDLPSECYQKFKFAYYNKQFFIYFIIALVLFATAVYFLKGPVMAAVMVAVAAIRGCGKGSRRGRREPYSRRGQ
jgi:hypothetical protein